MPKAWRRPTCPRWHEVTLQRLALVVIARNEAPRIARLLRSVSPWVDAMWVLDTGSTDGTPELAAAEGARVAHFRWCDDFAAARNAALDAAAADWHLVLDADEWLIDGGPALQALKTQPADFVGAVHLQDEGAAAGTVRHWLSRVLPGPLRYAGRVHEQPQHGLPVRRLPLLVGHDGYQPQRMAAKRGRNRPLLMAELAARPDDACTWYQLGIDHAAYEEHAQAAQALARADALCHAHRRARPGFAAEAAEPPPPWHTDLSTRLIYALKKTGLHAQALAHAEARMADCRHSPDFFFALGDLLLDWAAEAPAEAAHLLPMAQAAWQHCLALGEQPDQPGSVAGRGSFLAAHNLAVVCDVLGRRDEAAALRGRFPAPGGALPAVPAVPALAG
jgi:hypothetical protein